MEIFATIIIALITAVIGPIVLEWVKVKLSKKDKEDPIKKGCQQGLVIEEEIENIREELNGDRVWISMFHNGGHFLHTNKSIQKFSVVYEVEKAGVAKIAHTFTNIPLSLFAKSIDEMLKTGYIFIPNFEDPTIATFGLKPGAEAGGTKASYCIALFDIKTESCIGTVGIDYIKPKKLTNEEKGFFMERANRLSGFLSNFLNLSKSL
jgi:hypothetical protein